MGQESRAIDKGLTLSPVAPESDEIEVSLFGPGYGECVLVHIGNGRWVIVDSCLTSDSEPTALAYLRSLGCNPSEAVSLIVATHWHDDHIRGMAELVEVCTNATFCCASALTREEFLAALGALENRPATPTGSGMRELYRVFSQLRERSTTCTYAFSHRRVFNQHGCEVWSLSPSDKAFDAFLQQIGSLLPRELEAKRWIPSLTPNEAAVVLLIALDDAAILLGADLERPGWLEILETYDPRHRRASIFKLPHHGSQDAHEYRVWSEMLSRDPIAALTPWRRGGRELPKETDVDRVLSFTHEAYVTASRDHLVSKSVRRRSKAVEKTIRESGARIRSVAHSGGMIRLRKKSNPSADWNVDVFGPACRLEDY
jgi:hypothetical protein